MIKIFKYIFLTIIILIISAYISRGWVYRQFVTYKTVGERITYLATDKKLVDCIEKDVRNKKDLNNIEIIKLSLSITSKQLKFTTSKCDYNPNKLINSKKTNCMGYAAFYVTTCNYLLKKFNLADSWIAKQQIGQLYLLGNNVHKYTNNQFFKDHDFATIENKSTGEIIAVDPTINDYLNINLINYKTR